MDSKKIGERLKKLRGNKTLDTVAADLGVTKMAVSLWERGERVPNDEMKIRIAQYYKRSVAFLFFTD